MNTNTRFVFAIIAAFAAGAIVFAPFRSFARSAEESDKGQIVFYGNSNEFVVKNGSRVSLFQITAEGNKQVLKLLDHENVP